MKHQPPPRTYDLCCNTKPILSREDNTHVWHAQCEKCGRETFGRTSGENLNEWNKEVEKEKRCARQ